MPELPDLFPMALYGLLEVLLLLEDRRLPEMHSQSLRLIVYR